MDEKLHKQLTAAGQGANLQDRLPPVVVTEAALHIMPILQMLNIGRATGQPHRFRQRKRFPSAYPQGSGSTAVNSGSTYENTDINLKIVRSWGGVENFVEETTKMDTVALEVYGAVQATAYELAGECFWGDATANEYQFSGFDAGHGAGVQIQRIDGDQATLTKVLIDELIDTCQVAGARDEQKALFMSTAMQSHLGRVEAGSNGGGLQYLPKAEGPWPGVQIGWIPRTYRDIRIYPCEFTRPKAAAASIAVEELEGEGELEAGTYCYKVAPVTRFGEQGASAEACVYVYGSESAVQITVTMFEHADSQYAFGDALYWKIYRSSTQGSDWRLVKVVNALTYSDAGTPTAAATTLVDDGTHEVRGGNTDTADEGAEDQPLTWTVADGIDECIFYIDLDADDGVALAATMNETAEGLLDDRELFAWRRLADVNDQMNFMVRTYAALAIKQGAPHGVLRRVRSA